MNLLHKTYQFISLVALAFILTQCANPVAPEGGPKDESAPVILEMTPPNYSTEFKGERLTVQFDEYVRLQGLTNELMISPALAKQPIIRTRGKSVIIEIEEPLRDSTTYTFYFGNSIVDITEANPLKNFEYVFSTGILIDSMAVKGTVLNAFDNLPENGVAVMLYALDVDSIPIDSLPFLSRPVYVSRTNDKGEFELNNLKNIPYKLVALLDMNSNYLYDLPNEKIAFSDTIIKPAFLGRKIYIPAADTMQVDSINKVNTKKKSQKNNKAISKDSDKSEAVNVEKLGKNKIDKSKSISSDSSTSINPISAINQKYKPHELFMFLEVDSSQQIKESSVSKGSLITILLKYPCESFQLNPINFYPSSDWNLLETNKTNDTILIWVNANMPDSLSIEFVADTEILDTLDFVLNKINPNAIVDTTKIERAKLTTNVPVKMELGTKFILESEYPLINYDFSKISLEGDTLSDHATLRCNDSVNRVFYLDRILNEKTKYKLIIPDSAILDLKGRINDSIIFNFETKGNDQYATIVVNATPADTTKQWIIQLIDEQKKVVKQRIINGSEKITFEYLKPVKYKLKAILDENRNGIWDTGNYLMHRQAERVLMLDAEIAVRENWVTDQSWELK